MNECGNTGIININYPSKLSNYKYQYASGVDKVNIRKYIRYKVKQYLYIYLNIHYIYI